MDQLKYTTRDRQYWQLIFGLGLASFFVFATMYFIQPILPVLVEHYNISISYASLAMSMHIIGLIAGLIVIGFVSDRKGRRMFIISGIFIATIIVFLLAFIPYFSLIVILRICKDFL